MEARRAALAALLDEQWRYTLKTQPELASVVGDKRYNDRWNDVSPAAVAADLAMKRSFLERFAAIDTSEFPEQEVLNRELMVRELRQALEGARFKPWEMPVSQIHGIHLDAPQLVAQLTFESVRDYDDLLARYHRLPAAFDQVTAQMRSGMADGLMPPRFLLEKVVQQAADLGGLGGRAPEASPYADPVRRFPAAVPASEQTRLRAAVVAAIRDEIQPAYRRFGRFVQSEYLPRGRTAPGLWSLPDGAARYAFAVRSMTTTDLPPERIHQIGLREVAEIERQMLAIANRLGFPDLKRFNARVASDPALRASSPRQLLDLYRGHLDEMAARLPRLFGRLPRARLEVVPVEAYREKEASAAAYVIGARDLSRPGRVQVNTGDATSRRTLTVESNAYHEGIPGHHLQMSLALEMPLLPAFRRDPWCPAFTEGWALYAERLGKEVGLFRDPLSDYGRLQDEMLRAIRLVVDTGLHAKRWTRAQVVQFFHDHSVTDDEVEVQSETDRYMVWPAQALAYKIGQLKLLDLRDRARRALGDRFDLRAFHDEVLAAGALPLDVLESRIDRWIARQSLEGGRARPPQGSQRPARGG